MMVSELECGIDSPEHFRFRFGGGAVGADGRIGALRSVLLTPDGRRACGLVINTGVPFARDLAVPLRMVAAANEDEIHLSLSMDEARELHRKQAKWRWRNGAPVETGSNRGCASDKPPSAAWALSDSVRVLALDGRTGRLRQLLLDAASGVIEELVIEVGLFNPQSLRLPAKWVKSVNHQCLSVDATLAAVMGLPRFRGDRELRADILDAWFYDERLRPMFLRASLEVQVREGIATVEGYASTRRSRDLLLERARALPGIQGLRCAVVTDCELTHQVAAALGGDPRTGMLRPRITSLFGVISLAGDAPDEDQCEAALEVAASVPRVREVVNHLRVIARKPIEPAPPLRLHAGLRGYFRKERFDQLARVTQCAVGRLVSSTAIGTAPDLKHFLRACSRRGLWIGADPTAPGPGFAQHLLPGGHCALYYPTPTAASICASSARRQSAVTGYRGIGDEAMLKTEPRNLASELRARRLIESLNRPDPERPPDSVSPELNAAPEASAASEVELVDLAAADSFPASDPPCWTLGRERGKSD